MKRFNLLTGLVTILAIAPSLALAEELSPGDTGWMLTATALVLFMTLPGLSLFYAGLVSSRNVLSVLMQCFSIACLATVLWVIFGYSLAFSDGGAGNPWIGGLGNLFLAEVGRDAMSGTIPETVFAMFQLTFVIITPALVIGGFAERMRFPAMLWFTALWITLVYLPVCHWVWGGGWLAEMGVLDFAGGLVVHLTAGVAALTAAIMLGPRDGFPGRLMPPHNLTLSVMGAGMLWVGWFGFNAGSAVAANSDAGMAMLVTHISAAVASLTWMISDWVYFGKPKVLGIITGMVAGLGSITPASGFVGPIGAIVIGLSAGFVCFVVTNAVKQKFRIDDSLDVFAVHGIGGALGTILCGIFVAETFGGAGLGMGVTMGSQLTTQVIGVLAVLVWTGVLTAVVIKLVGFFTPVRADADEELAGLDTSQHHETGYHIR